MKKKGFKRLLAGILTGAMALSMSLTAFAADATPAPSSEVSGITSYTSGSYNVFRTVGDAAMRNPVDFEVRGMTAAYKPAAMSKEQADSVTWTVTDSTVAGIKVGTTYTPTVESKGSDGFTSAVKVPVSSVTGKQYGYAIVQADYTKGTNNYTKTVGFGIVFNPNTSVTVPVAKNVTCTFKAGGKTIPVKDLSVGMSNIAGAATYPNALYATKLAADASKGQIKDLVGIADGYITSITVDGITYTNDYENGNFWTYTVKENPAGSAALGAGILPLEDGYTIEWTYGPSNN